jgi:prepilin-type N-terminal cleavage/methylation domain-containing protein
MRKPSTSAFTLIEMLTVLVIIVILSGLVLNLAGYVNNRSARARTEGEISMLLSACESYKADNGNYPRDTSTSSVTDTISPKLHFTPTATQYSASSLFLYEQLTGDLTTNGQANTQPDGIPDDGVPRYMKEYDPRILNATKDPNTKAITAVNYLQDPFGFPYAYSTAAANDEQKYQTQLLRNPGLASSITRPTGNALHGFNTGSFDLWSTGGSNPTSSPASTQAMQLQWAKWLKNW